MPMSPEEFALLGKLHVMKIERDRYREVLEQIGKGGMVWGDIKRLVESNLHPIHAKS